MLEVGVRFHNRPKQWEYCLPQFIFFTPGLVLRNPRCQSFCSTVNESRRCYVWCIWSFYLNTSLRRNQCNWHKLHNCQKLHGPVHDSVFTSYFFLSDSKIILRWLQADVRSPLNSSRPMSSRGDNDNNCNLDLSRVLWFCHIKKIRFQAEKKQMWLLIETIFFFLLDLNLYFCLKKNPKHQMGLFSRSNAEVEMVKFYFYFPIWRIERVKSKKGGKLENYLINKLIFH